MTIARRILLFAGAAHAYTAALPFKVRPATNEPGSEMLELGQFDL